MKNLRLTIAATLGMTALTMAQNVPSYVPTNGLVGWWPFNGNADDESGNGNNGAVNGAILTTDRFSNINNAYSFDGLNDYIQTITPGPQGNNSRSVSIWFKTDQLYTQNAAPGGFNEQMCLLSYGSPSGGRMFDCSINHNCEGISLDVNAGLYTRPVVTTDLTWHHLMYVMNGSDNQTVLTYLDGILQPISQFCSGPGASQNINTGNTWAITFAAYANQLFRHFKGELDDIGIWNRALTQQEITDLYNASNCANNTAITPQTNTLNTGSTATFNASTSDSNPSYAWQSDFGQGYVTLNDFGNYSGTNTATLNIANVHLANHNQPIRVITTSGECIDTSNVAIISIADTCINTITDTTFITVTDTLIINSTITSLSPPNNSNTIKVFPNPTNDHITIDYGNFIIMTGYQLQIENSLGQQVFQTDITQQSDYLNLSNWGGNGLYFVHIIDPQGNTIDIRKIVLQ